MEPIKKSKAWRLQRHPMLDSTRAALSFDARLAFLYFLFAWLGYNMYETVRRIITYYVPLPVEDYWRVAQFLREYQAWQLATLWNQHNEHRIFFPELIFAMDMLLGHGLQILPLVLASLCYALAWAVLSYTVIRHSETPLYDRCLAVALAGVIAFWQGSAIALGSPFLLEWPLMQLAVILSLFLGKYLLD
jgi:hypothetical protein